MIMSRTCTQVCTGKSTCCGSRCALPAGINPLLPPNTSHAISVKSVAAPSRMYGLPARHQKARDFKCPATFITAMG